MKERLTRRGFVKFVSLSGASLFLSGCEVSNEWPQDERGILERISRLSFLKGSELRTTFFPRKIAWEKAQVAKAKGFEVSGDESAWKVDDIDVDVLASYGLKGARLVVVPFELTKDGQSYDWSSIDLLLDKFNGLKMKTDLCVGPLDYPYDPGIRLPKKFEDLLSQELAERGEKHVLISLGRFPKVPEASLAIRDYSIDFFRRIVTRYGSDPRVDKLYIGNEWPDRHGIEGINGATMTIDTQYILELVKMAKSITSKPIVFNTNIHPSRFGQIRATFDPILSELGGQGVLGIDTYPSRELLVPEIKRRLSQYGQDIKALQEKYKKTKFVFTEFQAEPWPPDNLAGKSWYEIYSNRPDVVNNFYIKGFPPTLESHLIASGIKEIGMWGAPLWLTLQSIKGNQLPFPARELSTISQAMNNAQQ